MNEIKINLFIAFIVVASLWVEQLSFKISQNAELCNRCL